MPQPTETRESTKYRASLFLQRFAPRVKGPTGGGTYVSFWSGTVTDTSDLDTYHIIEVEIAGERKLVNCSWPSGSVSVGDAVEGRTDSVGQYWVLALIGASLVHRHVYSDPLGGVVDGVNTVFGTTFAYETDQITVYLNGLALARSEYTQIDNRYVQLAVAPLPDADLQADYQLGYPAATIEDGKYVVAVDRGNGRVVRCQDVFAAAPAWESISQQADFGTLDYTADILIPSWAPAGLAFVCGFNGVWRTSNLFAANPADVLWTRVLSMAEVSAATDPTKTQWPFELAEDPLNEVVFLAVAVRDRGAWVARTSNLGAGWSWSNQAVGVPATSYEGILGRHRLMVGVTGYVYINTYVQHDYVYRSVDGGATFALFSSVNSNDWTGTGVIIHRNQAADDEIVVWAWNNQDCQYILDGAWPPANVSAGLPAVIWMMRNCRFDPNNDELFYAAVPPDGAGTQRCNCYLSLNHGATFTDIGQIKPAGTGFIGCLTVFERNGHYLYAGGDGSGADVNWPVLYVSQDAGVTWTDQTGTFYADTGSGTKPRLNRIIPVVKVTA